MSEGPVRHTRANGPENPRLSVELEVSVRRTLVEPSLLLCGCLGPRWLTTRNSPATAAPAAPTAPSRIAWMGDEGDRQQWEQASKRKGRRRGEDGRKRSPLADIGARRPAPSRDEKRLWLGDVQRHWKESTILSIYRNNGMRSVTILKGQKIGQGCLTFESDKDAGEFLKKHGERVPRSINGKDHDDIKWNLRRWGVQQPSADPPRQTGAPNGSVAAPPTLAQGQGSPLRPGNTQAAALRDDEARGDGAQGSPPPPPSPAERQPTAPAPAPNELVVEEHDSDREKFEEVERLRKALELAEAALPRAEERRMAASAKRQLLDKCQGNIRSFAYFPAVKSLNLLETDWTEERVRSFSETCASVNFRLLTDREKKKKCYLLEFKSSEDAKNAMDWYKGTYALKWNMNGYSEQIEVLAEMAKREHWSYKGEDGEVRQNRLLENFVDMSFKRMVAHQQDVIKFSKDGSLVAFDTRLRTPIEFGLGLEKIYAVLEATGYTKGLPYCFKGWYTDITTMFGGDIPKALSTENLNPGIQVPEGWIHFDEKLLTADSWNVTHILVGNFERLRKSCTTSSERPLQERRYLFLGNQEDAVHAFFRDEGIDMTECKLHPLGKRAMNLVYAEFASPEAAAAMEKWCRIEKKKIGKDWRTSCKPVLSHGLPTEDEVTRIADKLRVAFDHAKILAHDNPKCVLPQLFLPGNNIENGFQPQLLLPLHLNRTRVADAALAMEIKKADNSESGWYYYASTILTLDMALNNARLVMSLDVYTWLHEAVQATGNPQVINVPAIAAEAPPLVAGSDFPPLDLLYHDPVADH